MPSKSRQFRLTVPEAEAVDIIEQAEKDGFDTPQKLILHILRRFGKLNNDNAVLNAKLNRRKGDFEESQAEIERLTKALASSQAERDALQSKLATPVDTTTQVNYIGITKTQEVLEVIKAERHELLMLYTFQYIFPDGAPESVVKVMQEFKLTPGVYYMQHVCTAFPTYIQQIKDEIVKSQKAEAAKAELTKQVTALTTQRDEFESKWHEEQNLSTRLTKEKAKQLKQIATTLGVPDTVEHIVDRIKELEKEAETLQGLQEVVNEKSQTIAEIAEQRTQLEYDRNFYRDKSWWRKLWESITGEPTLPPQIPRKADDDEIPF